MTRAEYFREVLEEAGCPESWVPFAKYGDGRIILDTFTPDGHLNADYAVYVRPPAGTAEEKRLILSREKVEQILDSMSTPRTGKSGKWQLGVLISELDLNGSP